MWWKTNNHNYNFFVLDVKLDLDALIVKMQIVVVQKFIEGFESFTHAISYYWTN